MTDEKEIRKELIRLYKNSKLVNCYDMHKCNSNDSTANCTKQQQRLDPCHGDNRTTCGNDDETRKKMERHIFRAIYCDIPSVGHRHRHCGKKSITNNENDCRQDKAIAVHRCNIPIKVNAADRYKEQECAKKCGSTDDGSSASEVCNATCENNHRPIYYPRLLPHKDEDQLPQDSAKFCTHSSASPCSPRTLSSCDPRYIKILCKASSCQKIKTPDHTRCKKNNVCDDGSCQSPCNDSSSSDSSNHDSCRDKNDDALCEQDTSEMIPYDERSCSSIEDVAVNRCEDDTSSSTTDCVPSTAPSYPPVYTCNGTRTQQKKRHSNTTKCINRKKQSSRQHVYCSPCAILDTSLTTCDPITVTTTDAYNKTCLASPCSSSSHSITTDMEASHGSTKISPRTQHHSVQLRKNDTLTRLSSHDTMLRNLVGKRRSVIHHGSSKSCRALNTVLPNNDDMNKQVMLAATDEEEDSIWDDENDSAFF